jgi:ketosteroid isomerase-like protein
MLLLQLEVLENQGLIRIFTHEALPPGTLWQEVTQLEISNTVAAILLVTPDYLVSPDLMEDQLPPLLAQAKEGGTAILPLLVRPSLFFTLPHLYQFKPFNPTSKTLIEMERPGEKERFLVLVAEAVQEEVRQRREHASNENADLIRRAYQAYANGDLATMLEFVDPDLEWTYLDPTLAQSTPQVCHGRHELENVLRIWAEHGLRAELDEVAANGDLVMVGVRMPGIDAYYGRHGDDHAYSVCTVRHRRIVALRDCRDRQEALHYTGIES